MDNNYEQLVLVFASIIYEALPFVVLGVVIAGLLEEFVPQQAITKVFPRNPFLAVCLGGVLGLVFPMCECGIIVVMRRLLRKGLPLSVCVSYMLSGPIINVVVILSTYVAFNFPNPEAYLFGGPLGVVGLRVGIGFVVAVTTAFLVEAQYAKYGLDLLHPSIGNSLKRSHEAMQASAAAAAAAAEAGEEVAPAKARSWVERLNSITSTALHDFIDIMVFLILGAILAAAGRAFLERWNLVETISDQPMIAIFVMMAIAFLFCLCSEADAFVAANFPAFWPPASKMAFMVLGPMMDVKLYLMYTRIFRPRLIFTIMISVAVQVFVYCTLLHYAVGGYPPGLTPAP